MGLPAQRHQLSSPQPTDLQQHHIIGMAMQKTDQINADAAAAAQSSHMCALCTEPYDAPIHEAALHESLV